MRSVDQHCLFLPWILSFQISQHQGCGSLFFPLLFSENCSLLLFFLSVHLPYSTSSAESTLQLIDAGYCMREIAENSRSQRIIYRFSVEQSWFLRRRLLKATKPRPGDVSLWFFADFLSPKVHSPQSRLKNSYIRV